MVNNSLKRKRWWPRFGLRTLLVIPLVFAIYLALGQPTKTLGVRDIPRVIGHNNGTATYKAPLLLEYSVLSLQLDLGSGLGDMTETRSYYFWFFGAVAKLPFTSEVRGQITDATSTGSIDGSRS